MENKTADLKFCTRVLQCVFGSYIWWNRLSPLRHSWIRCGINCRLRRPWSGPNQSLSQRSWFAEISWFSESVYWLYSQKRPREVSRKNCSLVCYRSSVSFGKPSLRNYSARLPSGWPREQRNHPTGICSDIVYKLPPFHFHHFPPHINLVTSVRVPIVLKKRWYDISFTWDDTENNHSSWWRSWHKHWDTLSTRAYQAIISFVPVRFSQKFFSPKKKIIWTETWTFFSLHSSQAAWSSLLFTVS